MMMSFLDSSIIYFPSNWRMLFEGLVIWCLTFKWFSPIKASKVGIRSSVINPYSIGLLGLDDNHSYISNKMYNELTLEFRLHYLGTEIDTIVLARLWTWLVCKPFWYKYLEILVIYTFFQKRRWNLCIWK